MTDWVIIVRDVDYIDVTADCQSKENAKANRHHLRANMRVGETGLEPVTSSV